MNTTITATADDTTPRVWLGCMHHYNSGVLLGKWVGAVDADEVTLADLHGESGLGFSECEEIWGYDIENMPIDREMSANEAAQWGRCLDSIDEHLRPALVAWVRSGDYSAEGTGEMPVISDFDERFAGEWESFEDYAHDYADSIGLLTDAPEELARYFNWKSWIKDLAFDYTTVDAPNGGVFMFRSL